MDLQTARRLVAFSLESRPRKRPELIQKWWGSVRKYVRDPLVGETLYFRSGRFLSSVAEYCLNLDFPRLLLAINFCNLGGKRSILSQEEELVALAFKTFLCNLALLKCAENRRIITVMDTIPVNGALIIEDKKNKMVFRLVFRVQYPVLVPADIEFGINETHVTDRFAFHLPKRLLHRLVIERIRHKIQPGFIPAQYVGNANPHRTY